MSLHIGFVEETGRLRMWDDEMPHTAEQGEAENEWRVSFIPDRVYTYNAAITAMTFASYFTSMWEQDDIKLRRHERYPFLQGWAVELHVPIEMLLEQLVRKAYVAQMAAEEPEGAPRYRAR